MAAVETVLLLDRLRQTVAVKERLAAREKSTAATATAAIRKTMSVPNFVQMSQSFSLDNLSSLQPGLRSSLSFHDSAALRRVSYHQPSLTERGFLIPSLSLCIVQAIPDVMSKSVTLATVEEVEAVEGVETLPRPTFLALAATNLSRPHQPAPPVQSKRLPRQG